MSPSLSTGGDAAGGEGTAGPDSGAAWRQAEGPCWDLSLSFQALSGGGAGSPGWPRGCGGRRGGVVLAADRELMVEVVERKSWASCRGVVGGVGLRAVVSRAGSWRCHGAAHGVPGKYGVL